VGGVFILEKINVGNSKNFLHASANDPLQIDQFDDFRIIEVYDRTPSLH